VIAELFGRFRRGRGRFSRRRPGFGGRLWLRLRGGRSCRSDLVGFVALYRANAASNFDSAEEHDHDDGRGDDEQEDELLPAQLDFVKTLVGRVVGSFGHVYALLVTF
jgi:hypothetical protein